MTNIAGDAAYIPGVCNINHVEIARRKRTGYFGAACYVVLLAILVFTPLNRWYRIVVFVPGFIAAIGFTQAKNKFCVAYGSSGIQNAADGSTIAQAITDKTALAKDRQRTRQLNAQASIYALIATLLAITLSHM